MSILPDTGILDVQIDAELLGGTEPDHGHDRVI